MQTLQKQIETLRGPFALIIFSFAFSRILYALAGVRFDSAPLLWFWQLIDPLLLREDLLRSIWYLHTQPPLFNLFLGTVLKLAPGFETTAFQVIFSFLGVTLSLSLFLVMRRLGVPNPLALTLAILFTVSPSYVLYENWLFYTYPLTLLLCLSALYLHKFASGLRIRDGMIFFSILCVVILTRTLFHILWYLLVVLLLSHFLKRDARKILAAAAIPFLVVCLIYAKNIYIFGDFPGSTTLGPNLFKIVCYRLPYQERVRMVREGKLSIVSLSQPFSALNWYPPEIKRVSQTDIPVLDQKIKSTGFSNQNHLAYQGIAKLYLSDSLALISSHPGAYGKGVLEALRMYFSSPSAVMYLRPNRERIESWNRWFDAFVYGRFSEKPDGICWFVLFGYPLLMVFGAWRSRRYLPDENGNVASSLVVLFMCLTVLYVTAVGNALDIDENNRYRFKMDPYMVVLLGLFLTSAWQSIRRKKQLAPPSSSGIPVI